MKIKCDSTWSQINFENGEAWKGIPTMAWLDLMEVMLTEKQYDESIMNEDFYGNISNKRYEAGLKKKEEIEKKYKIKL